MRMAMREAGGAYPDGKTEIRQRRRIAFRRFMVGAFFTAVALLISTGDFAEAQSLQRGVSAFNCPDYVSAPQNFIPLAARGIPVAQSYLVSCSNSDAVFSRTIRKLRCGTAAPRNRATVSRNIPLACSMTRASAYRVISSKPANGSIFLPPLAHAAREARAPIRDSVAPKIIRGEIAQVRLRALEWTPSREQ